MSDVNSALQHTVSKTKSRSIAYQHWRLIQDKLVARSVVAGGLGVIVAILLIFFYLLYVVFPLLLSAKAEAVKQYDVPAQAFGKTLFLAMEEQNEVAVRFTETGKAVFFAVADGTPILTENLTVPQGVQISSFTHDSLEKGVVAYGLADGRMLIAKQDYKISYVDGRRLISPSITYPLGNQPVALDQNTGQALSRIAVKVGDKRSTLVAKTADNRILLSRFVKKESLFDDEIQLERSDSVLELSGEDVEYILLEKEQRILYLLSAQGALTVVDISELEQPVIRHKLDVVSQGVRVSAVEFLNGDLSLLIGDSAGVLSQWSVIRDDQNHSDVQKLREFKVSDQSIVEITSEQRRKGFMAVDAAGMFGVYSSTAEREAIKPRATTGMPVGLALSPRSNGFLLQAADGKINYWQVDNPHPEVSMSSLWQRVWYESYPKPDYIWQSSSASNDFEPKLSLTPLVFGTLKASFYAMLMAIPLSLMGAVYTGYFMAPAMRQYVKPGIEIMGALPSVILGFLAGLWLAPFVETHLLGIFSLLMVVPLGVMIFAYLWQYVPASIRQKFPDGWDAALLMPVIVISAWLAFAISPQIELWCFSGDLRTWLKSELGIGYDQRNALIVGLAMGFAVIPTIFSIAEDAIFSVPKHLTTGSLALGATYWQTMTRVVLLTASPGIFSAVMIGFGRAVGETMIVLMATGNTPVMDLSIFQGMRTLSANIAVEMPESEVDSTHYRVLFLAALVLFMFTFVFNTLAELVRQNLRQKYSSL